MLKLRNVLNLGRRRFKLMNKKNILFRDRVLKKKTLNNLVKIQFRYTNYLLIPFKKWINRMQKYSCNQWKNNAYMYQILSTLSTYNNVCKVIILLMNTAGWYYFCICTLRCQTYDYFFSFYNVFYRKPTIFFENC